MNEKESDRMITIQITEKGHERKWWKELFSLYLKEGEPFEIHCWKNEKEEIASARKYGSLEETNWEYGEVIKGILTAEFIQGLLECKCTEDDVYEKLTPYFTLQVEGICSEHYGTEIYIEKIPKDRETFQRILDSTASFASVSDYPKEQDR